jgi:processing peptidase subunit beta
VFCWNVQEIFNRLDAISTADVKRVANSLFYDRDLAAASIGPVQKMPDYLRMRRRTYWLRY